MLSQCAECAEAGRSCCVGGQIFVTIGDVRRIAEFMGYHGFVTFERMSPQYDASESDPTWSSLVLEADGSRRVLRRTTDDSCFFLRGTGCVLPAEVRPLLCRIYPYDFTAEGISGISATCPLSSLTDWRSILERQGMPMAAALNWHQRLYDEITQENRNKPARAPETRFITEFRDSRLPDD